MSRNSEIKVPKGLSRASARWFRAVVADFELDTSGELTTAEQAARSLDRMTECSAIIEAEGLVVDGERGKVIHPAAREERQHRALFLQAARQLGISNPDEPEHAEASKKGREGA